MQSPRISPKPFNAPPIGLWRATPPAIFPPILGLLSIGLGWRRASSVLNAPEWAGEMFLGAISLLYLFALVAYGAKILRRPAALTDDLKILPGRAGMSAASASGFLLAAVLVPYSVGLASTVLSAALCAHLVVALLIIRALVKGPAEQRQVSPAWHLSFVGFIIAPIAAIPLGWIGLSTLIFFTTIPIAVAVWGISLVQFVRASVPAPLRPLMAIHAAPVALFATVATMLDYGGIGLFFAWLAVVALIALLAAARFLTAHGFTPFWGAFTFPIAALVNAFLIVSIRQPVPFEGLGGLALVAATLAIVAIAFKIMSLWAKGRLSKITNASQV